MTKLTGLSMVLVFCGVFLMLGSVLWGRFRDPKAYWTEEQANAMTRSGTEFHAQSCKISHGHDGEPTPEMKKEYEASRDSYQQNTASFAQAQERFERPMLVMRWSGTVFLLVGAVFYWVARSSQGA